MVFADEDSPVYMIGGFENAFTTVENEPKVGEAFFLELCHGKLESYGDKQEHRRSP